MASWGWQNSHLVSFTPSSNAEPKGVSIALMILQEIGGSNFFGQVHWSISEDVGKK